MSALRIWLGFSTLFSLIYIVIEFALALKDGMILFLSWSSYCVVSCSLKLLSFQFPLDQIDVLLNC